jgi:arylsulfatase A-like enzyme
MYNVVMITLDSVRADHVGCYGYSGVETPNLDLIAARGILFEQAITHAPNTWVSHACLFSGSLPSVHGLRAPLHRVNEGVVLLAQWLKLHDYSTAGFPGNNLVGSQHGLARGFGLYEDQWERRIQAGEVLWRSCWDETLERAFEWLDRTREPFFLWLHYIHTHHLPEIRLPRYFMESFSHRWQHYDGKISYADQVCVGRVLGHLNERDLMERTFLVVLSDHGEELYEDDIPRHDGDLSEGVIRVPLIILPPRNLSIKPRRITSQVALVDIYPTLCELLSLPIPPHVQGRSFAHMMTGSGEAHWGTSMVYLENWPRGYLGARSAEWKLVLRFQPSPEGELINPQVEGLYHLFSDPFERRNLLHRHPSVAEYLRDFCLHHAQGVKPQVMPEEEKSQVEQTLRSLGYL